MKNKFILYLTHSLAPKTNLFREAVKLVKGPTDGNCLSDSFPITILIHEPVSKCLRSARSFKMRAKWRKKRVRRLKRKRRKMRARS
ncbi:hypothetical protein E4U30_000127 [Claviceps sp. LM220 group G6]|nr:hypothetical protein E4U30_000127 [Claviceps sp. LM220 group G6]